MLHVFYFLSFQNEFFDALWGQRNKKKSVYVIYKVKKVKWDDFGKLYACIWGVLETDSDKDMDDQWPWCIDKDQVIW